MCFISTTDKICIVFINSYSVNSWQKLVAEFLEPSVLCRVRLTGCKRFFCSWY